MMSSIRFVPKAKIEKGAHPIDRIASFAALFAAQKKDIPPARVFLHLGPREVSYGMLFDAMARLCRLFEDKGFKTGDRVILMSRDAQAVVVLFMACLRYGLTAVILNPEGSDEETAALRDAAKARGVFCDREKAALFDQVTCLITPDAPLPLGNGLAQRLFGARPDTTSFPGLLSDIRPQTAFNAVPADCTAYILFTSGTTSRPKGVEITHGNLLAQMQTFVRQYQYDGGCALLDLLPLHHTDGLTQGPVAAFAAGATALRPFAFSLSRLDELLDALYKYRATHLITVPSVLQLIDQMDPAGANPFHTPDFRYVISTAGYLDPHLWARFEARYGVMVVNVYGLTETVCEALYCGPDAETRRVGTVGKPVDTEVRLDDGEILLKGPHIMKGYFEMPEETEAVLQDGWLRTGDLGAIDQDGFVRIVGRKKSVIITGGTNIYPEDVADTLRRVSGVLDAAVWGEPDDIWGEVAVAALLPREGVALDTARVAEAFLKHASLEKLPRRMYVASTFPRGPAGKVILRDLRAQLADARGPEHHTMPVNIDHKVLEIAARSFKCAAGGLSLASTAEGTKGWNSLAHVEFLLALEKEFGLRMEPRDILRVRSLGDAAVLVREKTRL